MVVAVKEHYTRRDLTGAIREALQQAGKDPADLQPADLAAVDEFHIRGRQATLELANRIKPASTDRVLDIGSGLGGASRALVAAFVVVPLLQSEPPGSRTDPRRTRHSGQL